MENTGHRYYWRMTDINAPWIPMSIGEDHNAADEETAQAPALSAAARALAEAEERRRSQRDSSASVEIQGRGGLEPVRYGDWEVRGLASDF